MIMLACEGFFREACVGAECGSNLFIY